MENPIIRDQIREEEGAEGDKVALYTLVITA
jgi:hypothetical protein